MVNKITPFQINTQPIQPGNKPMVNQKLPKTSFGDLLKQSIDQVNQTQIASDKKTEALANGKNIELHDVMITAQKASITLLTAVEIRNKAIEAYQEMMRMQV